MARAIRAIFLGLAALAGLVWIGGYVYINSLACAFRSGSSCRITMPWRMTGEDLLLLVLIPASIVLILLFFAWLAHRRVKTGGADGSK
ncbi:methionine synthase [Nioella aestuarii]|uniref:methionine synthase n=1 Tax=Nioella aestuarii TaxID=1662864 RepID=UPI003D7FE23E